VPRVANRDRQGPAFVIDAVRTPYGRRGGALSNWHPVDLSAEMLSQLVQRAGIDGGDVDDVIFGCTTQVGAQACNIARRAVLAAGWPERVPGVTVDRHAASSAQAVHWAAQAVMSGAQRLVVAGGVEVMTAVPLGASLSVPSVGKPYGQRLRDRYKGAGGGLVPPGLAAEEVARRWSLSRSQLDKWALQSRERALLAQRKRPSYMLTLPGPVQSALEMDEALGRRSSRAELAALSPVYLDGGVVTAANMAAEGDGASGVLIAGADRAEELGLTPVARLVSFATVGTDPDVWPAATVPAAKAAMDRAGLTVDDIDWWEVHESSAAAVQVWLAEMKVAAEQVNPTGGALATTAPLGAVGAGLFVAAVSGLVEAGLRRALVCVAGEGGVATACVLERS
jgi:acetyl-CoA acyltransferase